MRLFHIMSSFPYGSDNVKKRKGANIKMKLTYLRWDSIAIIAIAALFIGLKALLTILNINPLQM